MNLIFMLSSILFIILSIGVVVLELMHGHIFTNAVRAYIIWYSVINGIIYIFFVMKEFFFNREYIFPFVIMAILNYSIFLAFAFFVASFLHVEIFVG